MALLAGAATRAVAVDLNDGCISEPCLPRSMVFPALRILVIIGRTFFTGGPVELAVGSGSLARVSAAVGARPAAWNGCWYVVPIYSALLLLMTRNSKALSKPHNIFLYWQWFNTELTHQSLRTFADHRLNVGHRSHVMIQQRRFHYTPHVRHSEHLVVWIACVRQVTRDTLVIWLCHFSCLTSYHTVECPLFVNLDRCIIPYDLHNVVCTRQLHQHLSSLIVAYHSQLRLLIHPRVKVVHLNIWLIKWSSSLIASFIVYSLGIVIILHTRQTVVYTVYMSVWSVFTFNTNVDIAIVLNSPDGVCLYSQSRRSRAAQCRSVVGATTKETFRLMPSMALRPLNINVNWWVIV